MADAEEPKPKKKGKGLIIGLALFGVLLLAGGGVVGFAKFKGLGPFAKKRVVPVAAKPKVAVKRTPPRPSAPTTVVKTLPPTTKVDPEEGAAKLAKLWNGLEAEKLLAIAKNWKDPELARVAAKMDPGKVAEILSEMPAKRASSLSREMQRFASVVPVDE